MDDASLPGSIVILDFGGQYAHLIARRVREFGAHSLILPPDVAAGKLKDVAGIILSGGPQSVYEKGSPQADPGILELGKPVLGLCYGLHWMTQTLGGEVKPGKVKEYGRTPIRFLNDSPIFKDCGNECTVWMSHGDEAARLPEGFVRIATSDACANAGFADETRHFYALQFHPEVTHSEHGFDMLRRFTELCNPKPWSMHGYADRIAGEIREKVGDRSVFMLVSGGVDSTVAFVLLNRVLGAERVQGLLVDTGLMRKDEIRKILDAFVPLGITNLHVEDASEEFFTALEGVTDPEQKRTIIGDTFLSVQRRVSREMGLAGKEADWMLGQGTIYPDTIETGGTKHADKIKTHHNRVPEIQAMIEKGLVIEPLADLYKDEVRALGEELGLPHALVWRHPFPGPGLGVRILCADAPEHPDADTSSIVPVHAVLPVRSVGVQGDGRTYRHAVSLFSEPPCEPSVEHWRLATDIPNAHRTFSRVLQCLSHEAPPAAFTFTPGGITRASADLLREADHAVDEEMRSGGWYERIWQFPVVLLPFGTRPGGHSIVLRPIASTEAMTANAVQLPGAVLEKMTHRLLGIAGIDCVFLDMTDKPPATIEWE